LKNALLVSNQAVHCVQFVKQITVVHMGVVKNPIHGFKWQIFSQNRRSDMEHRFRNLQQSID
jgi:hypothetical protein